MSKLILKGKEQNVTFWLEEDKDLEIEVVFKAIKRYIDFLLKEKDNGNSEAEKSLCGFYSASIFLSFSKEDISPEMWEEAMEAEEASLNRLKTNMWALNTNFFISIVRVWNNDKNIKYNVGEIYGETFIKRQNFSIYGKEKDKLMLKINIDKSNENTFYRIEENDDDNILMKINVYGFAVCKIYKIKDEDKFMTKFSFEGIDFYANFLEEYLNAIQERKISLKEFYEYNSYWLEEDGHYFILANIIKELREYNSFTEENIDGSEKLKILEDKIKTIVEEIKIYIDFISEEDVTNLIDFFLNSNENFLEYKQEVMDKIRTNQYVYIDDIKPDINLLEYNYLKDKSFLEVFNETRTAFDKKKGKHYSNREIAKKAYVPKQVISNIQKIKNYHVEKDTVIKLAFALECSLEFTEKLLHSDSCTFDGSRRDEILKDCFEKEIFDILEVNEILKRENQEILHLAKVM